MILSEKHAECREWVRDGIGKLDSQYEAAAYHSFSMTYVSDSDWLVGRAASVPGRFFD
jgi:hypothetical protein